MKDFYSLTAFFRNTPMPALDGNNAEHPPVAFVPAMADRPRWTELPGLIAAHEQKVAQRKKEAEGDFVGEWLYIYFNYGAKYLKKALEIYRKGE